MRVNNATENGKTAGCPDRDDSNGREGMQSLNPLTCRLDGSSIIEASAGTGKTHTITTLYLRLLIERELTVDSILVVTFTEAATGELRHRIRTRIREAYEYFRGPAADSDPKDDLIAHLKKVKAETLSARDKAALLARALHGFDEAAIHTIHAFCRRILTERAFESGTLFDADLGRDMRRMSRSAAEDFWRRETAASSPLLLSYLAGQKITPATVDNLAVELRRKPGAKLLPETAGLAALRKEADKRFEAMAKAWISDRNVIQSILEDDKGLSSGLSRRKGIYKVGAGLEKHIAWMDDFIAGRGGDVPFDPKSFGLLTTSGLKNNLKKNKTAPQHPFFDLAESLADALETCRIAFLRQGVSSVWETTAGTKEQERIFDFSDLILGLRDALNDAGSRLQLTEAVASRYRAALIDEFQDTDAAQYDIFKTLFSRSTLFLIGDPKQAIYSFRGADVNAYLDARDNATCSSTLKTNWRAASRLVEAVNSLFRAAGAAPFLEDIEFHCVKPAGRDKPYKLEIDGREKAPLVIWKLFNHDDPKGKLNKGDANGVAAEAVTTEIVKLLAKGRNGEALIREDGEERAVNPTDIAVLVRFHRQAEMVRRKLGAVGVPAALHSQTTVFQGESADDLDLVLRAVAEPSNETAVRTALTTIMLGGTANDLFDTMADPDKWARRLEAFADWGRLWRTRGFMAMFERLLLEMGVRERLLLLPGGARRLTDLAHLGELLHNEWRNSKPPPAGLVSWLSGMMQGAEEDGGADAESKLVRLETDAEAVRIVTVHACKGLQYPIVFCPFMWDTRTAGSKKSGRPLFFHEDRRQYVDLGSDDIDSHREAAFREALAEEIRLFYVALTRARFRCYTTWGYINKTQTSAPGYLFHAAKAWPDPDSLTSSDLEAIVKEAVILDPGSEDSFLKELTRASGGNIFVEPLPRARVKTLPGPAGQSAETPAPRKFEGWIDTTWRILSYSGLAGLGGTAAPAVAGSGAASEVDAKSTSGAHPSAGSGPGGFQPPDREEEPDRDRLTAASAFSRRGENTDPGSSPEAAAVPSTPGPAAGLTPDDKPDSGRIFTFPAGKRTGDCFHEIFEEIDFTAPDDIEQLVSKILESYGFTGEEKAATVLSMVRNVVGTEIAPGLKLEDVGVGDRDSELEFYFPVSPEGVKEILALSPGRRSGDPGRIRGVMKGYIDLVCRRNGKYYIIDYKSNRLGKTLADYAEASVEGAMSAHDYHLQYLIYAVAVHLLLEQRLPGYDYERDFGGVCYLFLRGMRPELGASHGVFFTRPGADIVSRLGGVLHKASRGTGTGNGTGIGK